MAVLVARFIPQEGDREPVVLWKYPLTANRRTTIGRAMAAADQAEQSRADREVFAGLPVGIVPEAFVKVISWRHATVTWQPVRMRLKVEIRTMPKKPQNPILGPTGEPDDAFDLAPGKAFQIGPFAFALENAEREYATRPLDVARRGAGSHRDVLVNGLAEVVARFRPADVERAFAMEFVNGLRKSYPSAAEMGVAVIGSDGDVVFEAADPTDFQFSRTVIRTALETQEVVEYSRHAATEESFTKVAHIDWAVSAPIRTGRQGEPRRAIYLSGGGGSNTLPEARQVAALFAEIYRALSELRETNARYRALQKFLPKPVRPLVDLPDFVKHLAPVEREVTVLFCDIRGSCSLSDPGSNLKGQWESVVLPALELMSRAIVAQEGVIGGLIGDAVMGFWGWPSKLPDQQARAIRAARAIHDGFQHTLAHGNRVGELGFGIGIANGPAIVGRMGNFDMHKVDVFGPTVNLAARLESMTKAFGVRILVDEFVAQGMADGSSTAVSYRELGRVVPAGFTQPLRVYEIFPDIEEQPAFSTVERYDRARRAFDAGDWQEAGRVLAQHPDLDGPSQHLAEYIALNKCKFDEVPPEQIGAMIFKK